MANSIIRLIDVTFAYPNGTTILKNFSLTMLPGEAWAVIGPSGCGKSTLLYLMAGLYQPSGGQLLVDGQPLSRPRPKTGLILQDYGLLPWSTVQDNIALGLDIRRFYGPDGKHAPIGEPLPNRLSQVNYWLKRLGIDHLAHHYPNQISGGQRQRTAIARTLVLNPDVLLMDEPFGALDALTREGLQRLILELRSEGHLTTVIVTHSIEEAVYLGQKILLLPFISANLGGCVIVDNSKAGSADYRQTADFFFNCNRLREILETL